MFVLFLCLGVWGEDITYTSTTFFTDDACTVPAKHPEFGEGTVTATRPLGECTTNPHSSRPSVYNCVKPGLLVERVYTSEVCNGKAIRQTEFHQGCNALKGGDYYFYVAWEGACMETEMDFTYTSEGYFSDENCTTKSDTDTFQMTVTRPFQSCSKNQKGRPAFFDCVKPGTILEKTYEVSDTNCEGEPASTKTYTEGCNCVGGNCFMVSWDDVCQAHDHTTVCQNMEDCTATGDKHEL